MNGLATRDRELIWHPFTQHQGAPLPIAIKKGMASYLYDEVGRCYLDLISSWWVNLHGHSHPEMAESIYQQAQQLEQVIFSGFTHEPAVTLCEQLSAILPPDLVRYFFSDNGSTAVEVALKMAYQAWANRGSKPRHLFLSFEGGYHGDTFGAMAVGAKSGFHDVFQALFFEVQLVPFAATWDGDQNVIEKEQQALIKLEQILSIHGDQIAAMILEPLVQGAGGMRMCRPHFIHSVVERIRSYGILVIFDEVMTGFGRTGSYFALDQLKVTPDFICLSKGLTGGFLPLALTVTTESVYQHFLSKDWNKAFAHGHSYTANPLACAAANTSLKLLQRPSTQTAIDEIEQSHQQGMAYLKAHCASIQHSRICGTIAAFEFSSDHSTQLNRRLKAAFLAKGLLLRPLANTIYLLPPYSTTSRQLEQAYQLIADILNTMDN